MQQKRIIIRTGQCERGIKQYIFFSDQAPNSQVQIRYKSGKSCTKSGTSMTKETTFEHLQAARYPFFDCDSDTWPTNDSLKFSISFGHKYGLLWNTTEPFNALNR